ncbi:MAG: hypothetical protein NW214_04075 [Pseudanabaenaceae cyanobacterium bins.39]|nr:hypothetical protein [Pseudanabaenaceae cyanobacterium bins.39]
MSLTYTPINELPFAPNFEGNDYLLIWDISQPANQARRLTFTALASYLAYTNRQLDWDDITNKPTSFTPATHTHLKADISDLSFAWGEITNKPTSFTPATHTHLTADISGLNSAIDARLTNLPNGAIIGGVAHFFQDTPPATRIGGDPLQSGDQTITQKGGYFWDSSVSLWLSPPVTLTSARGSASASTGLLALTTSPVFPRAAIFIASGEISVNTSATPNNNDYWIGRLGIFFALSGLAAYLGESVDLKGISNAVSKTIAINYALPLGNIMRLQAVDLTKMGAVSACTYSVSFTYHFIL